jgi:hypothetical protein
MDSEQHPSLFQEVLKMAQEARDRDHKVREKNRERNAQLREKEEAEEAAREWCNRL